MFGKFSGGELNVHPFLDPFHERGRYCRLLRMFVVRRGCQAARGRRFRIHRLRFVFRCAFSET